ncbi:MAG: hypothetical protein IJQ07_04585 [Clostridia bacterium]|nr:hypothetical protein [Clostridia bacterium]
MDLKGAKVYSDGSHYIAIQKTTRPKRPKRHNTEKEYVIDDKGKVLEEKEEISTLTLPSGFVLTEVEWDGKDYVPVKRKIKPKGKTVTRKALFTELYSQTKGLKPKERKMVIIDGIKGLFNDIKEAQEYVEKNIEREHRNYIVRTQRMNRIVNITPFNYFCTFTYDSEKVTAEVFKKKLLQTLQNLHSKKKWLYMGVWERGKETERLHFHGLFYIPDMIGNIYEKKDYNVNKHKVAKAQVNTYFEERFGRNDFQRIDEHVKQKEGALQYIKKYLTKTNDRVIYSRGLSPMRKLDILEEDIICGYLDNPNKFILFDNFTVINEGTIEGKANNELLLKMPRTN